MKQVHLALILIPGSHSNFPAWADRPPSALPVLNHSRTRPGRLPHSLDAFLRRPPLKPGPLAVLSPLPPFSWGINIDKEVLEDSKQANDRLHRDLSGSQAKRHAALSFRFVHEDLRLKLQELASLHT